MNKKLSSFEAICLLVMITLNTIFLSVPKLLLTTTASGAFANCIFIGILALIYILFIIKIFKKFPSSDILDISNYLGGYKLKSFIGFLFVIILFLGICISIANFAVLLKTVYFENSPMLFLLLFFIIGMLLCNILGFGAIKKSNCFYLPITLISIFIILKSKLEPFTFTKLTPIFGTSIQDTFFYGIPNIFLFTNIILMLFLPPYLDNNKKYKKITLWSFFISWLLYLLSVSALLTAYPLASIKDDINSIYIISKRIELTEFIQRSDGLFVFIWSFAFFSYISLMLYLITSIMKKLFNFENEKMLSYSMISFILGITYYIINTNWYRFQGFSVLKYIFLVTIFIISLFIIIFSILKKKNN